MKRRWMRLAAHVRGVLLGVCLLIATATACGWVAGLYHNYLVGTELQGPGLGGSAWWFNIGLTLDHPRLVFNCEWGRYDSDQSTSWEIDGDWMQEGRVVTEDQPPSWAWRFTRIPGVKGGSTPELWRLETAAPILAILLISLGVAFVLYLMRVVGGLIFKEQRLASAVCLHCGKILKPTDPDRCPACGKPRSQVTVSKAERPETES